MYVIQVRLGKLQEIYDLNILTKYNAISATKWMRSMKESVWPSEVWIWHRARARASEWRQNEIETYTRSSITISSSSSSATKDESLFASSEMLHEIALIFTLENYFDGKIEGCRQLLYVQLNVSYVGNCTFYRFENIWQTFGIFSWCVCCCCCCCCIGVRKRMRSREFQNLVKAKRVAKKPTKQAALFVWELLLNRLQQMHIAPNARVRCDDIKHGINNEVIISGIAYANGK